MRRRTVFVLTPRRRAASVTVTHGGGTGLRAVARGPAPRAARGLDRGWTGVARGEATLKRNCGYRSGPNESGAGGAATALSGGVPPAYQSQLAAGSRARAGQPPARGLDRACSLDAAFTVPS